MTEDGALGRVYRPGEVIIRQGEVGDCMHVIQEGQVEIIVERDGREVQLAVRGEGEFIGEMAIFEHERRMATVRALGFARVLTIDKNTLLRHIHDDPSAAFHIIRAMSRRIRQLSTELARLRDSQQQLEMETQTDSICLEAVG